MKITRFISSILCLALSLAMFGHVFAVEKRAPVTRQSSKFTVKKFEPIAVPFVAFNVGRSVRFLFVAE